MAIQLLNIFYCMFYLPSYILIDTFFCQEYFIEIAQTKIKILSRRT